ncbi:MAG: hypothetical protein ABL907_05950 [Hyphomicrobium sp.]
MHRLFGALLCALLFAFPCLVLPELGSTAAAGEPAANKVVSVDGTPDARKITVRVAQRLTETALKDLAAALRDKAKPGEKIAAVAAYLPREELSQSPWAVVKLDPGVDVKVLGLRVEEETAFRAEAQSDARDVIGVWLTSPPALPGRLTLVRAKGGKTIAEWHLRSGEKTVDEVFASKTSKGQRYDIAGSGGAYYLATWSGDLELGDKSRVIAVAERLQLEKRDLTKNAATKDSAKGVAVPAPVAASSADVKAVPAGQHGVPATATAAALDAKTGDVSKPQKPGRYAAKAPAPHRAGAPATDFMGSSIAR